MTKSKAKRQAAKKAAKKANLHPPSDGCAVSESGESHAPALGDDTGIRIKPGMTKAQIDKKKNNVFHHRLLIEERRAQRRNDAAEEEYREAEDYSDTANERPEEYRQGGYHPVVVGDLYNDRYRVVRKLGWGYFSTVWLVWDYTSARFQAMKIQKSDRQYRDAAFDEIKLLRDIMHGDPRSERQCARMSDHFEHTGPHGVHVCMVFDILGENLLCLIERYEHRGIPIPIVKSLTREILIGLDHIHSMNIIHTDLKPENVLLSQPKHGILREMRTYKAPPLSQHIRLEERDISTMTKSQRKRYYQKIAQKKKAGEAGHVDPLDDLGTAGVDSAAEQLKDDEGSETDQAWEVERFHHCCVADFGNSCYVDNPLTDEVQTRQYRAPEVIVGNGYGPAIDIWSCACMVFELLTGDFLFDPKEDDNGCYSRDEDHLALITELLDGMPDVITRGNGRYRDRFYDHKGRLRNIPDLRPSPLASILHRRYRFSIKKSDEISNFLMPMLEADPRYRASARQVLTEFSDWFEIQEDDYDPLCRAENDNDGDNESTSGDGDDERSACSEETAESGAEEWYLNHPVLNPSALQSKGLTLQDMMLVMDGGVLENAQLHRVAKSVLEEVLNTDGYSD